MSDVIKCIPLVKRCDVWHAFCTFIQHVRKVYKIERLICKMLEIGASFLSFSGNMKNGGN